MGIGVQAKVAEVLHEIDIGTLPEEVLEKASLNLFDWLVVAAAGANDDNVQPLLSGLEVDSGEHYLIGRDDRGGRLSACLWNGLVGHALDYDDTHMPARLHMSTVILPALFVDARRENRSYGDLLGAFVSGVEVGARIGRAAGPTLIIKGWHATGVIGCVAAAAAVAKFRGYDRRRCQSAIGFAAAMSSGLVASFGTMAKPLQAGNAAMSGLIAADLARLTEGPAATLDSLVSLTIGTEPSLAVSDHWEILDLAPKPYASCALTHPALDVLRDFGATDENTERVTIGMSPLALKVVGNQEVRDGLSGKFSLFYCAAQHLLGPVTLDSFSDDSAKGERWRKVAQRKIEIAPVEDLAVGTVRVRVCGRDGSIREKTTSEARGERTRPMSWDDVLQKAPVAFQSRFVSLRDHMSKPDRDEETRVLMTYIEKQTKTGGNLNA